MSNHSSPSVGYAGEKSNLKGPRSVAQDVSVQDLEEGINEQEQLKRNMGARHINMIAIAGMIVSLAHFPHYRLTYTILGYWVISWVR